MIYRLALIGLLILSITTMVMLTPIEIRVHYRKEWRKHRVTASLRLIRGAAGLSWGPFVYEWEAWDAESEMNLVEVTAKTIQWIKDNWQRIKTMIESMSVLSEMVLRTRMKEWRWYTQIGLEDPAQTAMAVGTIWAVKGWLWGEIHRRTKVEHGLHERRGRPAWGVQPSYNRAGLRIDLTCCVEGSIGGIIMPVAGFLVRRKYRDMLMKRDKKEKISHNPESACT